MVAPGLERNRATSWACLLWLGREEGSVTAAADSGATGRTAAAGEVLAAGALDLPEVALAPEGLGLEVGFRVEVWGFLAEDLVAIVLGFEGVEAVRFISCSSATSGTAAVTLYVSKPSTTASSSRAVWS